MSKLPAILIKADFYSKGRNIRWMAENGYQSVPILQAVWIASSQERGCKILKEDAYCIPFLLTFPADKVRKILESAVAVGLLDGDENYYWNSQIVEDSKKFKAKHSNYSEASKKRERAKQEQDSGRILKESGQNHIDTDIDNEPDNDLDLKYELVGDFNAPQIHKLVSELAKKFKTDGRGRILQQQTVDNWQGAYRERVDEFIEDAKNTLCKTKAANLIPLDRSKPQVKLSTRDFLRQEMEKENAKSRSA